MKKIILITLATFLGTSCVSLKPSLNCEPSFTFSHCLCRCYNLKKTKMVKVKKCKDEIVKYKRFGPDAYDDWLADDTLQKKFPLASCDKFSGHHLDRWATYLVPKAKEMRQLERDRNEE